MKYIAHVNELNEIQTVKEHSENTAKLCRDYAIPQLKDLMYIIGILHDVGKYQNSFQKRIEGKNIRVEHSICGALAVQELYAKPFKYLIQYCVAGHHSGIPDGGFINDSPELSTLHGRLRRETEDFSVYKQELLLPKMDQQKLLQFLLQDCENNISKLIDKFAFLTRYCFSCLVDADSMDTASFCGEKNDRILIANFPACLKKINAKFATFVCETRLQKSRAVLQQQVFEKVDRDAEIYLLNMPTGSGKTLCSMKFALERAIKGNKKRIIYIIPYNSIIDQTSEVFENLFGKDLEILRHQSTFSYEKEDSDELYVRAARSAVENWDAPFVITTAVQFFESVYSNKRKKLRKLHNMADSILIFDEAHLMPQKYLKPCLQAISYVTRYLNSEAVFLTATMPNFSKLIKDYAISNSKVLDLITDTTDFEMFRKCSYCYLGEMELKELASKNATSPSRLIITNERKTARRIYEESIGKKYHLSTYMTPCDRKRVLGEIRKALQELEKDFQNYEDIPEERKITIVSTSLIEAGVDLDVYTVFRELSGLDSILQAGGRCNREGKRENAETYIFEIVKDIKKASVDERRNITKGIIKKYSDISSPESIEEYYERLFFVKREDMQKKSMSNETQSIESIPFKKYAEEFELIDSAQVSVVVPRDKKSEELIEMLDYAGMSVIRKLQDYTCSLHKWELDELIKQHVIKVHDSGVCYLTNRDYYNENIGILFEAQDYFL